jgi:hypothetical protein
VLEGGDWDEGWQYGPLSVAEYALAARVAGAHGIRVDGISLWLASVLRRYVHALNPSDQLWAGGDFDEDRAYIPPQVLPLDAVALGDAPANEKRWAKGEIARLKLSDKEMPLFGALAALGDPPAPVPRASWPTWTTAAATGTLFTRSSWDDRAIWFVAACAHTTDLDHRSPNAGNFVLSRGRADLIVDPSPYGSRSTLTGNAPTVRSRNLPPNYVPSQGAWGQQIAWRWATKTEGGVVAARCDYTEAYRFKETDPDIAEALRDFVLLPSPDGHDASLVVVDRATTGAADLDMDLRFRVPAELAIDATGTGTATIAGARLAISGGKDAAVGRTNLKDCFKDGTTRGNCDAARFPVTDYRVEIAGPEPRAVHVIEATDARGGARHADISGPDWTGVSISGTRDAVVVWPNKPGRELAYRAPRGTSVTHVVLDAPAADGKATVSARPDGDGCAVTVAPGGPIPAQPIIVTLNDGCAVTADGEQPNGVSSPARVIPHPRRSVLRQRVERYIRKHRKRAAAAAAAAVMGAVVILMMLWRRKKPG